jgi:DNA repair ATPase RecN
LEGSEWPKNYFNYFTEIEEHFQRARGTGLFLLSPLDWALIETWRTDGIPLEAVLKGIDETFEKRHSRKSNHRRVNSLAYCSQAVIEHARRAPQRQSADTATDAPFTASELRSYLTTAAAAVQQKPERSFQEIATVLGRLADEFRGEGEDLEALERRLTSLEEKMVAALRSTTNDEDLYAMRESLERELKLYRGKMSAEQVLMLERRYLDSALLERARLPRLSLFYLR